MEVDDDPCKASTDAKVRLSSDHGRVLGMRVLENRPPLPKGHSISSL